MSPAALSKRPHRGQRNVGLPREDGDAYGFGLDPNAFQCGGDVAHGDAYYDTSYSAQVRLRKLVVLACGLAPHHLTMAEDIARRREAFRAWVAEQGSVAEVARRADVPATTIYSYLSGKSDSLKGTTQDRITSAYGVTVEEMFGIGLVREVPVVGYVGAGAAAHYYAADQGELDRVTAPEGAAHTTVARRVRGQSIGRHFDGWLIFSEEVRSPVTADLLGELCIVGLPDERVLVKWLQPSRTDGLYHLESETEPAMLDQEIVWASKVSSMRPR